MTTASQAVAFARQCPKARASAAIRVALKASADLCRIVARAPVRRTGASAGAYSEAVSLLALLATLRPFARGLEIGAIDLAVKNVKAARLTTLTKAQAPATAEEISHANTLKRYDAYVRTIPRQRTRTKAR